MIDRNDEHPNALVLAKKKSRQMSEMTDTEPRPNSIKDSLTMGWLLDEARRLEMKNHPEARKFRDAFDLAQSLQSALAESREREGILEKDKDKFESLLQEAVDRLDDMLMGDDGQAWQEARKFVIRYGH